MRYRFELSNSTQTINARPVWNNLAKEYSVEDNQQFFRVKLAGEITFVSDDYSFLMGSAFNDTIRLRIYADFGSGEILYYSGKFFRTDCEINEDDQTIKATVTTDDAYEDILNGQENEYDLIKLAPEIEHLILTKRPLIQVYSPGENVIACFLGGMYWEQSCKEVTDTDDLEDLHFQENYSVDYAVISGVSDPDANGEYKQVSTSTPEYFDMVNENGYHFTVEPSGYQYYLRIRHNGNVVAQSFQGTKPHIPGDYTFYEGGSVHIYAPQTIWARVICDTNQYGGHNTFDLDSDDIVDDNKNYHKVIEIDLSGQIFSNDKLSDEPTEYGIYQPGQYYVPPYDPIHPRDYFPIAKSMWGKFSYWFAFSLFDWITEATGRKEYTLKDAFPLSSVISVLLREIAPDITYEGTAEYSEFFYGGISLKPVPYKLFISPKSNVLRGEYDEPAQKAPITFKLVMDMLRDCYQCYWFVEGTKLRIEHISFFNNGGTYTPGQRNIIDLTGRKLTRNDKDLAYHTSSYKFDKPNMPSRFEFGWMDNATTLFNGNPIEVLSNYVDKKRVETIRVTNFSSDVDYMLLNPSDFSQDGFALLAPLWDEDEEIWKVNIWDVTLGQSTYHMQNALVSFFSLQRYYLYSMPSWKIKVNGFEVQSLDITKLKSQEIRFATLQDIETNTLIKTHLGEGKIEKLSINLSSRVCDATLKYETTDEKQ